MRNRMGDGSRRIMEVGNKRESLRPSVKPGLAK